MLDKPGFPGLYSGINWSLSRPARLDQSEPWIPLQAFTIPEMDQITSQNERLLDEVFAEDFSSRLVSLDEMISRSENITTQFRSQVRVPWLIGDAL